MGDAGVCCDLTEVTGGECWLMVGVILQTTTVYLSIITGDVWDGDKEEFFESLVYVWQAHRNIVLYSGCFLKYIF